MLSKEIYANMVGAWESKHGGSVAMAITDDGTYYLSTKETCSSILGKDPLKIDWEFITHEEFKNAK